jgi:hypothetical protein
LTSVPEAKFKQKLQKYFERVEYMKPDASFEESTEIYIIGLNYMNVTKTGKVPRSHATSSHPQQQTTTVLPILTQEASPVLKPKKETSPSALPKSTTNKR